MSIFVDRDNTALLVIDVQNGVVQGAFERDQFIANINVVVAKARASATAVVWVQHTDEELILGSKVWEIVPELHPGESDPIVNKSYRSSFEATVLDQILENLRVGHLIITGAQSDYCVRHTLHSALERGYDVTLVADAHSTLDAPGENGMIPAKMLVDELNRSFREYRLPGRGSKVATAASISL